jgi:hypothetical protein
MTPYKGIYRAAAQHGPAALSINTSVDSPYDDQETVRLHQARFRGLLLPEGISEGEDRATAPERLASGPGTPCDSSSVLGSDPTACDVLRGGGPDLPVRCYTTTAANAAASTKRKGLMSPSSKRQTTFAKMQREQRGKERRAAKLEKKHAASAARKAEAAGDTLPPDAGERDTSAEPSS